jgi:hypothetical protein
MIEWARISIDRLSMDVHSTVELTRQQAEAILQDFVCTQGRVISSMAEQHQVQQAMIKVVQLSDYQTIGICADTVEQALVALDGYLQAFGQTRNSVATSVPNLESGVYLKFNTQRRSLYWDAYVGPYRGVLVTCQSDQPDGAGGTYGHLPLSLFN